MAAKPECAAWFSGADIGNSVRKSGAPQGVGLPGSRRKVGCGASCVDWVVGGSFRSECSLAETYDGSARARGQTAPPKACFHD